MKTIGIVRSIDSVGRIVLPVEIRKELGLVGKENQVEMIAQGNEIILKKYTPSCIFCHETENLIEYNGQKICRSCAIDIAKL